MRAWRADHPLNPEQRFKMNSRCYANTYQRRGKLNPEPCEACGDPNSQKHHDDYSKPLQVRWLCRPCHLELHEHTPRVAVRARAPKRSVQDMTQRERRERFLRLQAQWSGL